MKIVKASGKNVRGSAVKARIPARIVEGMKVSEALPVLKYMEKKAAKDVYKVVHSAKANAENNYNMKEENLVIKSLRVDRAFGMKRYKSAARGMAKPIKKHFCHIFVELEDVTAKDEEKKETKKTAKKTTKKAVTEKKTTKKKEVKKPATKAKKTTKSKTTKDKS